MAGCGPNAASPSLKPSELGGLIHLGRLLGLRQDAVLSTDAVFVSFDLDVDSNRLNWHQSSEKLSSESLRLPCLTLEISLLCRLNAS